jgi:hypothetical protein
MQDDRDEPRQIDKPASEWAACERVVPWHVSPLPSREELWSRHVERNRRERDKKPKEPPRPRGIQRRV